MGQLWRSPVIFLDRSKKKATTRCSRKLMKCGYHIRKSQGSYEYNRKITFVNLVATAGCRLMVDNLYNAGTVPC
jgi:hypothetical protein